MDATPFGYEVMAATSEARRENVVSLAAVRAERQAALPVSFDLEWDRPEEESWALGKTIWFAVVISTALWAVIAGALWFI
jgi:hypothetical protein